ncbi:tripartite tricarboxylate transporter TctB family protein [Pelagibacterium sediminicola]|uniref:tripartite tricarboxylate transporter TctB family protein n=1 Tax=Pelagibacterium sediminicola TaxID=2248761 RepID=UPI000E321395|nr:tripartite tricarboxylate transporter TctB family protein [Pelagibacterium sediminicola]
MLSIRSQKDLVAGAIFVAIGIFFVVSSLEYRLGTPARMGPGFFPLILGILLSLLGSGVILTALRGEPDEGGRLDTFNLRGLGVIIFTTVLFGILIQPLGLLVTLSICAAITSLAAPGARPLVIAGNVGVQLVIGLGVFHLLLKLQIPLLPRILGF